MARTFAVRPGNGPTPAYNRLSMRRDISRTLLVIAEQPQLWATVRDRLDPRLALVRNARPAQLADVWSRADPWPWLVVGAAREVPAELVELVAGKPIPVRWYRRPEGPLPSGTVVHESWSDLAAELDGLAAASVFGLRFAPRRGVWTWAERQLDRVPELEGLMAAHPLGLPPFQGVARARRAIERHRLPCRLALGDERVRLVEAPA